MSGHRADEQQREINKHVAIVDRRPRPIPSMQNSQSTVQHGGRQQHQPRGHHRHTADIQPHGRQPKRVCQKAMQKISDVKQPQAHKRPRQPDGHFWPIAAFQQDQQQHGVDHRGKAQQKGLNGRQHWGYSSTKSKISEMSNSLQSFNTQRGNVVPLCIIEALPTTAVYAESVFESNIASD